MGCHFTSGSYYVLGKAWEQSPDVLVVWSTSVRKGACKYKKFILAGDLQGRKDKNHGGVAFLSRGLTDFSETKKK